MTLAGADGNPMLAGFLRQTGDGTIYPISVGMVGAPITLTDTIDAVSAIYVYSNTGDITFDLTNSVTVNQAVAAQGAFGDTIGLAGVDVFGFALSNGAGPNVTLTHSASLTVNGGNATEGASTLEPTGTRTAQLS